MENEEDFSFFDMLSAEQIHKEEYSAPPPAHAIPPSPDKRPARSGSLVKSLTRVFRKTERKSASNTVVEPAPEPVPEPEPEPDRSSTDEEGFAAVSDLLKQSPRAEKKYLEVAPAAVMVEESSPSVKPWLTFKQKRIVRASSMGQGLKVSSPESTAVSPRTRAGSMNNRHDSDASVVSPLQGLEALLKTPAWRMCLLSFAKSVFCEENLEALLMVYQIEACEVGGERKRLAQILMEKYVQEDAPSCINVDARTLVAVRARFKETLAVWELPADFFAELKEKLLMLLFSDVLPRFQLSPMRKNMENGVNFRKQALIGDNEVVLADFSECCEANDWNEAVGVGPVRLWEKKTKKTQFWKGRVCLDAEAVDVAQEVSSASCGDWLSSHDDSTVLLDFGDYSKVFALKEDKDVFVLCSMYCVQTVDRHCIVWHSIPPQLVGSAPLGRLRRMDRSGFVVRKAGDGCELLLVLGALGGFSTRDLVLEILSWFAGREN